MVTPPARCVPVRVTVMLAAGAPSVAAYVADENWKDPGVSFSWMVTLAVADVASVAPPPGELSVTWKVLSPPNTVLSRIGTVNVALVAPAGNVSVPEVAV